MQNKTSLIIVIVLVLACVIGAALYTKSVIDSDSNFWAEYEAAKAASSTPEYKAQQEAKDKEIMDNIMPYVIGGFVLFLAFIFGGDVMRAIGKPLIVLMGFIAILGVVAYFAGYADKNADGTADYQDVRMVQPSGDDAKNDARYADVNEQNAKATMTNRISLGFLLVMVTICIFVLGFISIYLGSWKNTNF